MMRDVVRPRRTLGACTVLTVMFAAVACRHDATASTRATVRDSAGVQIVENSTPAWPAGTGWHLSAEPLVSIGAVNGDPHYQLSGVSGAVRLSDGRIVIANRGSDELRFYDASGAYLSAVGRKGKGPGEFQWLAWLTRLSGDSVLVFDRSEQRASVFDATGHLVRVARHATAQGMAMFFTTPVGVFADGSMVMSTGAPFVPGGKQNGIVRPPVTLLRYDASGALADTIGQFPGNESYVRSTGMMTTGLIFGRNSESTVHGNELYVGSTDRYEIGAYTPDGTLQRSIRRAFANLEVTSADINAVKQEQIAGLKKSGFDPNAQARFERMYADMPVPKTMPAYGDLMVDAVGDLWVADYRRPSDHQPRWTVFDSTGQMLGAVAMPERFTPYDIGADYVLGVWKDELDVQYVREFGLEKPAASGDDRKGIPVRTGDT
jgi:hypothetical protein